MTKKKYYGIIFIEKRKETKTMTAWEMRAKEVSKVYGMWVDWEERFYHCPECDEPVYECDWTEEELDAEICPICGFTGEEE